MNPRFLLLFAALPLFGAVSIAFLKDRSGKLFKSLTLLIVLCLGVLSAFTAWILFKSGGMLVFAHKGCLNVLSVSFALDRTAAVFLLFVQAVYLMITVFVLRLKSDVFSGYKKYLLLLLFIFSVNSLIICADIFYFYLSLETATLAAYCLLMNCARQINLPDVFKSMVFTFFASALILLAIVLTLSYVSALNMADISRQLEHRLSLHGVEGNRRLLLDFIRAVMLTGIVLKFKAFLVRPGVFFADAEAIKVFRFLRLVLIAVLSYAVIRIFVYTFFPALELDAEPFASALNGLFGVKRYVSLMMDAVL